MNTETVVQISVDGKELQVPAGISVAAAVLGHDHPPLGATRSHQVDGSSRAPYCLMGVCFECLMEIDGERDVQSCLVQVKDGMQIRRQLNSSKAEAATAGEEKA